MLGATFTLLARSGCINKVVIHVTHSREGSCVLVWPYAENPPTERHEPITLTRGGNRSWATLDSAYSWVRKQMAGMEIPVTIETSFVNE